ncbi:MAG: hypothetical protein AAGB01_00310 [Cyanobacteria bacterium P01_F01_bin.42]
MTSKGLEPTVHEIVHVEIDSLRLYAEVIQVINARANQRLVSEGYQHASGPRLWVRPLCICEINSGEISLGAFQPEQVFDLRGGSDLVWPAEVFREVLDTEWMQILVHLQPEAPALGMLAFQEPSQAELASQKLRQFLSAVKALNG